MADEHPSATLADGDVEAPALDARRRMMQRAHDRLVRRNRRRVVLWRLGVIAGVGLGVYLVVVAVQLWYVRSDVEAARSLLEELEADVDVETLVDTGGDPRLDQAADLLDRSAGRANGPLVAPLRILPGFGTQLDSLAALTDSGDDLVTVGRDVLAALASLNEDYQASGDRVTFVREARRQVDRVQQVADETDLGPETGLVGALADARGEFAERHADLVDVVADASGALAGVEHLLTSDDPYLLLAANNGEMRAGSGAILSLGEIDTRGGQLRLSDMTRHWDVPDASVPIDDEYEALYGPLDPGGEITSANLLPDFARTAEILAARWTQAYDRPLAGALILDSVGVAEFVRATGPVEVDGVTYDAEALREYLLVGQYAEFSPDESDPLQQARRERLDVIAQAVFDALEDDADPVELARVVRSLVEQRHLMVWSDDTEVQDGWRAVGADGSLEEASLLVALLNRGADKMDSFVGIDAALSRTESADGNRFTLSMTLTNTVTLDAPPYVLGPPVADRERPGQYVGILNISLPGATTDVEFVDRDTLLEGPDGPGYVVATPVTMHVGESIEVELTFELPAEVDEIVIEPSARVTPIVWTLGEDVHADGHQRRVRIENLG